MSFLAKRNGVALGVNQYATLSPSPSAVMVNPTLSLNFTNTETLDPRITFTRASSATRYNSSGVLVTMANNQARFDYNPVTLAPNGLLIEEQRTNLITYSEQFNNAVWINERSSEQTNVIVSPDGTLTGDKLVEDTSASTSHRIIQSPNQTKNATYTFSFYAKAAERTFCRVFLNAFSGNNIRASFNLTTGAVSATGFGGNGSFSSAFAVSVGNGWFRCSLVGIPGTSAGTGFDALINLAIDGTVSGDSYTGDGYSGIYIWGAQLEAGAFPTSYIKTEASQVTRSADAAVMTGTNFSSWYNATEGTIYTDALQNYAFTSNKEVFNISDNTLNNRISIVTGANNTVWNPFVVTNGVNQATLTQSLSYPPVNNPKITIAVQINNFASSVSGAVPTTDTLGTLPTTVDRAYIGATAAGVVSWNSTIRNITYYPQRLTNANLQAITR